jgi:hypothetical protein
MIDDRVDRLLALKAAAERIADPHDPYGLEARQRLKSTLLTPQGIEYALENCLEHRISRSALSGLVKQTPLIARSHILLSANVFVAAFRAIALGLAQSPRTIVRAASRAPVMTQLLHAASGEAFELTEELCPRSGDHYWAYGSDSTLNDLRARLPQGVQFHPHGHGMGAAVFREDFDVRSSDLQKAADALARDTIAFDQRGCLSPRIVFVEGSRNFAETVCDHLVESLEGWEARIPRGELSPDETADALRHEATMTFVGSCVPAGMGLVFLDPVDDRVVIPPIGRYLHVTVTGDAISHLVRLGPQLTTVGLFNADRFPGQLRETIGERRYVNMGEMQRPRFDGPVDLRHGYRAETL